MTTTLADLLAGVDMEGGENFCDSVYNFLKNQGKDINLFTNSGFGVWSQSDANKGLAILPFDSGSVEPVVGETLTGATSGAVGKVITVTVTGGTWGGTNAAGTIELGAVSGTYQDNENINGSVGGGNILTVNGDATIGVRNDPMNDNSVALWTLDGAGIVLASVGALYTVTTTAANQRAWIPAAALTAGKIYKIELDIQDGTDSGIEVQGYLNDGAAQYGKIMTTAGGMVSVSWTFECATTNPAGLVGFRIIDNMAGNNIQIRRFSCYEITPCCTAADSLAFDGWYKNVVDLYRQHNDGGTYTKDGSFYALKCVPASNAAYLFWPLASITDNPEFYQQFASRPATFGMWVKTSVADHARLSINDGVATDGAYHTGGGAWEWLELTIAISAAPVQFLAQLQFKAAPNVDGTTIVYISQPMLVFGWSLGEGMYQPRLQEMIWLEKNIPSNTYDGLLNQSDLAFTDLNIEADSDAMLPKGAKMIAVQTEIEDAGSGAGLDVHLELRKDATAEHFFENTVAGKPNDIHNHLSGLQPCDVNGDVDIHIDATAANTFDINEFEYHGVQVS